MEILAIIPAKGGSKRLPNKNIRRFRNKCLLVYPIEQARESKYITRTIVVTNDSQIASIARQYNAEVLFEPDTFARIRLIEGDMKMMNVVRWLLEHLEKYEGYKPYYFILLQPTSPLRTVEDIDKAIRLIIDTSAESVDSRCNGKQNGAIYICRPHVLTKLNLDFVSKNHQVYKMSKERSIDIDELKDFEEVERLIDGN